MTEYKRIPELLIGSLVVERYVPVNRRGKDARVQWLAQVVDKDGDLALIGVYKTRREALKACQRATA